MYRINSPSHVRYADGCRDAVAEELTEAVEHGFIFAVSVGLFQRFDLLQVFSDGDVQRRLLDRFAGCFKPGDAQFAAFQFMVLALLYPSA